MSSSSSSSASDVKVGTKRKRAPYKGPRKESDSSRRFRMHQFKAKTPVMPKKLTDSDIEELRTRLPDMVAKAEKINDETMNLHLTELHAQLDALTQQLRQRCDSMVRDSHNRQLAKTLLALDAASRLLPTLDERFDGDGNLLSPTRRELLLKSFWDSLPKLPEGVEKERSQRRCLEVIGMYPGAGPMDFPESTDELMGFLMECELSDHGYLKVDYLKTVLEPIAKAARDRMDCLAHSGDVYDMKAIITDKDILAAFILGKFSMR